MSGPCCREAVKVARRRDALARGMIENGIPSDFAACGSGYQLYLADQERYNGRANRWTVAWKWLEAV